MSRIDPPDTCGCCLPPDAALSAPFPGAQKRPDARKHALSWEARWHGLVGQRSGSPTRGALDGHSVRRKDGGRCDRQRCDQCAHQPPSSGLSDSGDLWPGLHRFDTSFVRRPGVDPRTPRPRTPLLPQTAAICSISWSRIRRWLPRGVDSARFPARPPAAVAAAAQPMPSRQSETQGRRPLQPSGCAR